MVGLRQGVSSQVQVGFQHAGFPNCSSYDVSSSGIADERSSYSGPTANGVAAADDAQRAYGGTASATPHDVDIANDDAFTIAQVMSWRKCANK